RVLGRDPEALKFWNNNFQCLGITECSTVPETVWDINDERYEVETQKEDTKQMQINEDTDSQLRDNDWLHHSIHKLLRKSGAVHVDPSSCGEALKVMKLYVESIVTHAIDNCLERIKQEGNKDENNVEVLYEDVWNALNEGEGFSKSLNFESQQD